MHKSESVQEKEINKILCGSEMQTDDLIPVGWPDLIPINKNKRTYHQEDIAVTVDHWIRIKKKRT